MDVTSKLPEEMLIKVLAHLPSLRDKLRVEGVSRRFQRCLVKLLNTKPLPFKWTDDRENRVESSDSDDDDENGLEWIDDGEKNGHLNGYKVAMGQSVEAVQMLAKKVKFESVLIELTNKDVVERILRALANSDNDCLGKVNTFNITTIDTAPDLSESCVAEAVSKCSKLTTATVDFFVHINPESDDVPYLGSCPMDLGVVFEGRALTQLHVGLEGYTQQQMTKLYQSLQPNTLKNISLYLRQTTIDTDALVNDLTGGAWMAVEAIDLVLMQTELPMDQLIRSLVRLPKLRKCYILYREIDPTNQQLVAALNALFACRIKMTLCSADFLVSTGVAFACDTVALIRQVQAAYPDLEVGFGPDDGQRLILSLGKASFEHNNPGRWLRACPNADCAECSSFYPTVIRKIIKTARQRANDGTQDVHLPNCRLDRCRIDSVVADLNAMGRRELFRALPLSAELDEQQNIATITFAPVHPVAEGVQLDQVQITVDCGQCLGISCLGCLQI